MEGEEEQLHALFWIVEELIKIRIACVNGINMNTDQTFFLICSHLHTQANSLNLRGYRDHSSSI